MTKTELLAKLNSSEELVKMAFVPVAEVINWVNELEDETPEITNDLIDSIVSEIVSEDIDLIEDYDLSMSYREVELDSVTIDSERVERAVRRALERE
jgi:hypothetical protein